MVNDKAAAAYHPSNGARGFDVVCEQCNGAHGGNVFHSMWYDVAERFADLHEDTHGHETSIVERTSADG